MKREKGSGLLIVVVMTAVIIVILFTVLIKPNTKDVPVEGIDPDRSILEQSGDIIRRAEDVKDVLESKNEIIEDPL